MVRVEKFSSRMRSFSASVRGRGAFRRAVEGAALEEVDGGKWSPPLSSIRSLPEEAAAEVVVLSVLVEVECSLVLLDFEGL